jgi:hypothetical protein
MQLSGAMLVACHRNRFDWGTHTVGEMRTFEALPHRDEPFFAVQDSLRMGRA